MEIFEHLVKRQEMDGPEATFRFKSVKNGKRIVQAQYETANVDADPHADRRPIGGGAHSVADADADAGRLRVTRSRKHKKQHNVAHPHDCPAIPENPESNNTNNNAPIHDHCDADGAPIQSACSMATFVVVDNPVMLKMHETGIPTPMLSNGPSDGPPQYRIPCHTYEEFLKHSGDNDNAHDTTQTWSLPHNSSLLTISPMPTPPIDPRLLHTPMPTPSPTQTPTHRRSTRRGNKKT